MLIETLQRTIKVLGDPRRYWHDVVAEPGDIHVLLVPHILLLAAIPSLAFLVGGVVGGLRWLSFGVYGKLLVATLLSSLVQYGLSIGMWIAFGYIIDGLALSFAAQRDIGQSMKLATGAMTPVWLGQILYVTGLPAFGALGALVGLGFAGYLLYLGLPTMNGTPQERASTYAAAAVGSLVGVWIIVVALTCVPRHCCMAGAVLG